ncbi:MAG: hypothetical protein O6948_04320, partial [Deltaproteobacteria bacterium]|nr:hypothetical protein [Deltaproteobacteria bacterium]
QSKPTSRVKQLHSYRLNVQQNDFNKVFRAKPVLGQPAVSTDKLRTNGWNVEGPVLIPSFVRACPETVEGINSAEGTAKIIRSRSSLASFVVRLCSPP